MTSHLFSVSHSLYRDGPDQASPQIGQFSGNSVQEGVSTTANQILIKFHSDFSTSGFFVLHYYGIFSFNAKIKSSLHAAVMTFFIWSTILDTAEALSVHFPFNESLFGLPHLQDT